MEGNQCKLLNLCVFVTPYYHCLKSIGEHPVVHLTLPESYLWVVILFMRITFFTD